MLESFVFATVMCGFFGIILKKNPIVKSLSMDATIAGVIGYCLSIAPRDGLLKLITGNAKDKVSYADPIPQARILTGIAIGFSIQALMLVGAMKLARDNSSLVSVIEKNNTP